MAPRIEVKIDKMFEQPPPHSLEAEMALLGAMILDPKVTHDVIMLVKTPDDFFLGAHAAIYDALVKLYDQKQAGNLVLLADALRDKEILKDVGGGRYLQKLAAETPGPATAAHFAKIVADKAKLRRLIDAGGKIVYDAYHVGDLGPEGAREVIDRAESRIFEIAQQEETSSAQPLSVLLEEEVNRLRAIEEGAVSGLPTGFHDLDELTRGLQDGEMIIIAARPSMGKTALALNIAEQVALGGVPFERKHADGKPTPVAFFSMEMSKSSIAQRMLSARSGISTHEMRSGRLKEDQYMLLGDVCVELERAPIFVDDTPGLTILGLRTRARRLVAQHGVRAIFVDYLQLMTAPNAARESRQVEVSAISRGIKALARELSVPVVCLSQLNRGPETRGDNRPRMSDLRESGSIEQDADVVILLHREAYYHVGDPEWDPKSAVFNEEHRDKLNMADLIIAKQRNGPTDVVHLLWDPKITRFKNFAAYPGGTGFSSSYTAQGGGRGAESEGMGGDPFKIPVSSFSPGKKTGPIPNHRDGGGPERPPIAEEDDDLPV